ncbi:MAG: electron transfer flavoprotein subunit beta/FixA family protein [Candidatus Helarchaeota archaeon]|nr:electron transfer flavoprotein subunit beta/FixA family protein [Candidatus Helarchaeota archaeon]
MKVIVCIKQVPESTEVKLDPKSYTLDRSSSKGIINPFDVNAVEETMRIAEKLENVETIAISMGPPSAEEALKEALTYGLNAAYLLSDKAFAGADTLATAYTLARAIEKIGNYDLILCGKQAIDGDTAQVGPGIAENLNLAQVTNVKKIDFLDEKTLRVESELEDGYKVIEVKLPAVLTVTKEINVPRIPSFKTARLALKKPITKWGAQDLDNIDKSKIGMDGSPTAVIKVETPTIQKNTVFLKGSPSQIASVLIQKLKERYLI